MSAIPELEQALVAAAQRHYGARSLTRARRRVARPLRLAAPVLALAAVALLVVGVARLAAPSREERPALRPAATPEPLGDLFSVFARPRRTSDALPVDGPRSPHWVLDRSRRVATLAGRGVFLVPSTIRPWTLCIVSGARSACATLRDGTADRRLFTLWSPTDSDGVAIFVDGIDRATLTLAGGRRLHRAVRDNAVLLGPAAAVSWDDAKGRHHAESLAIPTRCPLFEPLPPDALAQARQAALAAQPRLYPQTSNPRVVSVARLKHGMRGSDLYAKCGGATGRRAIEVELRMTPPTPSASLSQGTLLVGRLDGRMTVWAVLH